MRKGRGSAVQMVGIVIVVGMLCMVANLERVQATTHAVGGSGGWNFDVNNWPKGKRIRAWDVLIFNYDPAFHNVVAVDGKSYVKCTPAARAKVYGSGKDKIRLVEGQNNFICSLPGHCESGIQISINAV